MSSTSAADQALHDKYRSSVLLRAHRLETSPSHWSCNPESDCLHWRIKRYYNKYLAVYKVYTQALEAVLDRSIVNDASRNFVTGEHYPIDEPFLKVVRKHLDKKLKKLTEAEDRQCNYEVQAEYIWEETPEGDFEAPGTCVENYHFAARTAYRKAKKIQPGGDVDFRLFATILVDDLEATRRESLYIDDRTKRRLTRQQYEIFRSTHGGQSKRNQEEAKKSVITIAQGQEYDEETDSEAEDDETDL